MTDRLLVAALMIVALLPAPSARAAEPPAPLRTIEVTGHGETRAAPDQAFLALAIETHAASAEDATRRNAELSQKVAAALKARLGERGRIWTGGYSLFPEYSERPAGEKPKAIGYRAENSINLQTGAIALAGSLIDTAVAAGANRISSLSFGLRDEAPARNAAIAQATKDAQGQAQALAAALGVRLKQVIKATVGGEPRPMPLAGRMMTMEANVPTPVEPGELTAPATVSLVYEIE